MYNGNLAIREDKPFAKITTKYLQMLSAPIIQYSMNVVWTEWNYFSNTTPFSTVLTLNIQENYQQTTKVTAGRRRVKSLSVLNI